MCFSPSASFLAGAGLTAVGVISARHVNKKGRVFAAIPFLFAIQQVIEGAQWLSIENSGANLVLTYAYLFFAYLLWPLAVPLAVLSADEKQKRRLVPLVWVGAGISLGYLFLLFTQPIDVNVVFKSIAYAMSAPFGLKAIGVIAYVSATAGPFLVSSIPALQWFGLILLGSFAIAYFAFAYAYVSVWCFFAAVLSGLTYWLIKTEYRRTKA